MTRRLFVSMTAGVVMVGLRPLLAHDVYRFVGTVVKWDDKENVLDMQDDEIGERVLHVVLRDECKVVWSAVEVPRSTLKAGIRVIVDAVGIDLDDIEGVEVEIHMPHPSPKQ